MRETMAGIIVSIFEWVMMVALSIIGYGVMRIDITVNDCFAVNVEVKDEGSKF